MGLLLTSCHKCVHEDLSKCPQGLDFVFYEPSPTNPTKKHYPDAVKEVRVFAFDEQGRLIREFSQKEIVLSEGYFLRTDYYRVGTTDFLAWAGGDLSQLDFSAFVPGKTTREEMIVALKRQVDSYQGAIAPIYVGVPDNGPLTQEGGRNQGSIYDRVPIRLTQITNRLNFTVRGLHPRHDYTIQVVDDNSRYTIAGKIAEDDRFVYKPSDLKKEKTTFTAWMDVMKLEKGRNARLIVTDTTTGKEIFNENLVEGVLLKTGPTGTASTNTLDRHVFDIVLIFEYDKNVETYMAVRGSVNNWNIVFRNIGL